MSACPDKGATHTVDETIKFLEKKRDRLQSETHGSCRSRVQPATRTPDNHQRHRHNARHGTHHHYRRLHLLPECQTGVRYLGICPTYEQSGTSVNIRGHINRNGDAYTRGLLYVAAWTASRFNTKCGETYTRLRQNGKPGKTRHDRCRKQARQTGFCRCHP